MGFLCDIVVKAREAWKSKLERDIIPDFRSKMKKMVLNHLIKHHFYLLWR